MSGAVVALGNLLGLAGKLPETTDAVEDVDVQQAAAQKRLALETARVTRPGDALRAAGMSGADDAGAAAGADTGPSKRQKSNGGDALLRGMEEKALNVGILIGERTDDGEEEKEPPAPVVVPEADLPLREVLHKEDIPKSLSNLYLFWIGLESNVTEPITLPSTTVFAESKKAFEDAKATVRFGSAPYDEIYIWLMGEEMIPKQLCATVRSVLNTIEQRRTLLRARRIPFWDLFVGQDAVFLSKWITAQHLYNVQSNRSWSGRRENHQALAQITRDAAEYFCTRP